MNHCRSRYVRSLCALALLTLIGTAAPAAAQNRPYKTLLRNGITVITKEMHSSHVLAVNVFVRGGSSLDPAEKPGLANFTHRMLLRGTTQRRTPEQVAAPLENLGGTLQARADYDYNLLLTLCTADALDPTLSVLADVVRRPLFDAQEIEKERGQILGALGQLEEEPGWLVQRALAESVCPEGPYRNAVPGTAEAVRRITRDDLVGFHRRYYGPENLIIVIVGNIDRAAAEERVRHAFGDMPATGHPPVALTRAAAPSLSPSPRVVIRERRTDLAHLAVAFPVGAIQREEYPAVLVMNSLLGGGMGSRLAREVRGKQGLGYDLGTVYTSNAGASFLTAYIRTLPIQPLIGIGGPYGSEMVIDKAKEALLDQFDWVREHPVDDKELVRARNYAIGTFIIDHQRTLSQARYLGWFELVGLGYQFDDELPQLVAKVTKDDLVKLARKRFQGGYALALVMPAPVGRP